MRRSMSETFRPTARTPRGFADKRAADLRAERRIIEAISEVYERCGFERLDTGAFEYADALGKFLPDSDRPNEGVFALQDDDEQWMALRYDLTAPLARFAAQHWETLPKPFRRYAVGWGRCGATRSPDRGGSASSSSATPTPSAPRGPRPTPR
jgi:histidyl-tRNA synthetase